MHQVVFLNYPEHTDRMFQELLFHNIDDVWCVCKCVLFYKKNDYKIFMKLYIMNDKFIDIKNSRIKKEITN